MELTNNLDSFSEEYSYMYTGAQRVHPEPIETFEQC
jgi:hypothetical protein